MGKNEIFMSMCSKCGEINEFELPANKMIVTKDDFTDDLLNRGYTKGYQQGKADRDKELKENCVFISNRPIEDIYLEAKDEGYQQGKKEGAKEAIEKAKEELKSLKFSTGRAWFDFDAALDRAMEKLDKVEKQIGEKNDIKN